MTSAEMLAELREVVADEIPTYAWSDIRALAYLNEGQDKFCEDTGFFVDTSTFTIPTVDGTRDYQLDSRIIRVNEVFIGNRRLKKGNGLFPVATAAEPTIWQTDRETGKLTVYPTPTTIVTMKLHTWRYPKADMTVTDGTPVQPEIPKRMHRACIEWAAWKCYGHHDKELQDSTDAKKHLVGYRQYVLEGRALKRNMDSEQIEVGCNSDYVV